jgi:glycosyltransferase involved in cell wall biosynthesis
LKTRLRIALNAQVDEGAGGIETVLLELTALTELDGPEEYIFVGHWNDVGRLRSLIGSHQRIVPGPQPPPEWQPDSLEPFKRAMGPLRPVARGIKRFFTSPPTVEAATANASVSEGFYEKLDCDVVHFPFQSFTPCELPTIYNPHDLQHFYFPEFFTPGELDWRERVYPSACRAAHTVVVATETVKQDVVRHYRINPEKIQVIPWSPPPLSPESLTPADDARRAVAEKYRLDSRPFALYPAMTWEHKNHLRLLDALALLRERERVEVKLICTGALKSFWPHIEKRLAELGLESQVKFTGLIPFGDLHALYSMAQFVVVPTLYEAASAPLFEAWQHDVAVACSAVTSLPEQAADAALLFNPLSTESIAGAVARMATDTELREDLRRRGALRLQDFSLERTAKAYRAVYRRAAGSELNEEDRWLLSGAWMRAGNVETEALSV